MKPVLREDAGAVLADITKISNVELAIPTDDVVALDAAGFFEGDDDPLAPIQAAARARQGGVIRIRWGVGRGEGADQGFLRRLLARVAGADTAHHWSTAKANIYVEGSNDKIPVDFIHDKIVATVDVGEHVGRGRELDPGGVLRGMQSARQTFINTERINEIVEDAPDGQFALPEELIEPPAEADDPE